VDNKLSKPEKLKSLNLDELRVWQHPIIVNIIEILEIFSIEPGGGKLAASLVLASDQSLKYLKQDKGDLVKSQIKTLQAIRKRAFEWLKNEVSSRAYRLDPSQSTDQIDKAVNCALLLLCEKYIRDKLPREIEQKAYAYIAYMSEQGWPRDDLLPFVVSQIKEPKEQVDNAKQYLISQVENWRSQADIRGIAFALISCQVELEKEVCDELVATIRARVGTEPLDLSTKAWALLALSNLQEVTKADLDNLSELLLDELSHDRLVNNEITSTIRLISQFPFETPDEIAHRVKNLKERGYAPASRIVDVSGEGILIDLFNSRQNETWSFALSATQVAFVAYVLIKTGYHGILGAPVHYRAQLEGSVEKYTELQENKATTIPIKFVIWYNVCAVFTTASFAIGIGFLLAVVSGDPVRDRILQTVAAVAVMFLSLVFVKGRKVFSQEFVLVEISKWIGQGVKSFLKLLGIQ
jgi:hypothetical protein